MLSAPRRAVPRRARLALLIALAACVDLGGTPPDAGPEPDTGPLPPVDGGLVVDVAIAGLAFRPMVLEIPRGTTVRWTNYDPVAHTVTEGKPNSAELPVFDSPLLFAGEVFELRFDDPGEFLYWCRTHPNVMKDAVIRVF